MGGKMYADIAVDGWCGCALTGAAWRFYTTTSTKQMPCSGFAKRASQRKIAV
jgi:hypothetical protein